MDFYSTEERNKLIQEAMDSYKYKDLPLEIDDFFAIHKSVYVYKVVKTYRNRLKLLKILPDNFVHGNDNYDKWIIVSDRVLKYELEMMIKHSNHEKEKRYNLFSKLKNEYNINTMLLIIKDILEKDDKMLNLSICINLIDKLFYSKECKGRRSDTIDGLIPLFHIIKHLS